MIYAISDIHGNKEAFDSILEKINLQEDDKLYILGDVIDHYPDGIALLQQIMRTPNMYMLIGNHEYMMMGVLGIPLSFPYANDFKKCNMTIQECEDLWLSDGGKVTYEAWNALPDSEKAELEDWLKNLPLEYDVYIDKQHFKLTHATWSGFYVDVFEEECQKIRDEVRLRSKFSDDFFKSYWSWFDLFEHEEIEKEQAKIKPKAYFTVWNRSTMLRMTDLDDSMTIFGHTPTCIFTSAGLRKKITTDYGSHDDSTSLKSNDIGIEEIMTLNPSYVHREASTGKERCKMKTSDDLQECLNTLDKAKPNLEAIIANLLEKENLDIDNCPMEVYRCGNAIDIDCGAGLPHYSNNSVGRLACIRLDDLKVFYSNDAQLKI